MNAREVQGPEGGVERGFGFPVADGLDPIYAPFKFSFGSLMIGAGDRRNELGYDNLDLPVYLPPSVIDGSKYTAGSHLQAPAGLL